MRKVLVVGASSSLLVQLAAEFANRDLVLVVEGDVTAAAAARALSQENVDALCVTGEDAASVSQAIREDLLVLGGGCHSLATRALAIELSHYEMAMPLIEPYLLPQTQSSQPYWQQGTPAFHRKQQSMRAKARRR